MEELSKIIPVRYVIDIGCGVGEWSNGNPDYCGIDYRVNKSKLLTTNYDEYNLNREFPPIPHKKFDLALCLEVAEHLHPSRAEPLVEYLCSLSNNVLFSAAIPYQGGTGHINEQWQSYWAGLFRGCGFTAHKWTARSLEGVELWYRQNMVLYQRGSKGRKVEDFVLPEYYTEIVKGLLQK